MEAAPPTRVAKLKVTGVSSASTAAAVQQLWEIP